MVLSIAFASPNCDLVPAKTAISDSEFVFTFSSQDNETLEALTATPHTEYLEFRSFIKQLTNTEAEYLLKIQRNIYRKHSQPEAAFFDQILNKEIGSIRDINCLESILLTEQLLLNGHQNEFGAYILKSKDQQYKIYFITSHDVSVTTSLAIYQRINEDLKNGFILWGHLHSHPFALDGLSPDIAGTTIPSYPDCNVYRDLKVKYNLQNAFVTNGFSTIAIPESQFDVLPKY